MLSAHRVLRNIYKSLLISPVLLIASYSYATPLGFVELIRFDDSGQKPFHCTESVVTSPDDKFAYSSSFCNDAINTFNRDPITGKLSLISSLIGNETTGLGLRYVKSLIMHPSGKYVFAFGMTGLSTSSTQPFHSTIYAYERDTTTGALTFISELKSSYYFLNMHISADGHFLYVETQNGIDVAQISSNGILTHTQHIDTTSALSDDSSINSLVISPDNKYVYVDSGNNSISWLLRDATSGSLTYVGELLSKGMTLGSNSNRIKSIGKSNDGKHLYAFIIPNDINKTVLRHFSIATDGSLIFVDDTLTTPAAGAFYCLSKILISSNDKLLYFIDGCSDTLQVWLRDTATGTLKYIGAEQESRGSIPEFTFSQTNDIGFSNDGNFLIAAVNAGITTVNLTADISLTSSFQKTVATKDNYSGVISVSNAGPADAHDVEITLTGNALSNLKTATVSLPQGSCTQNAATVICKLPSLPSKAVETIELKLQAPDALDPLQINATKTQAEIDPDNQTDSLQISVQPVAMTQSSSSAAQSSSSVQSSSAQVSSASVSSQQSSSAAAVPNPSPSSTPSKKGGGSIGFEWLLLLSLFAVKRKYKN